MPNNTRREFLRLAAGMTLAATNPWISIDVL